MKLMVFSDRELYGSLVATVVIVVVVVVECNVLVGVVTEKSSAFYNNRM